VENRATGHGDPREPLGPEFLSDARAKSEASLRRHTFVRYPTRVWKFERLSLIVARFPNPIVNPIKKACSDAGRNPLRPTIDKRHGGLSWLRRAADHHEIVVTYCLVP
jgi:hypothetical protein